MKKMLVLALFALLVGSSFAGCASDAYRNTCVRCHFDDHGKVNRTCSSNYKNSGIACTSATYPIMSAKYAAGQCPQVDACAAQLQACVAQKATGDDLEDCATGDVSSCYFAADTCSENAARACGEFVPQGTGSCQKTAFILVAVLAIAGFAYYRR